MDNVLPFRDDNLSGRDSVLPLPTCYLEEFQTKGELEEHIPFLLVSSIDNVLPQLLSLLFSLFLNTYIRIFTYVYMLYVI